MRGWFLQRLSGLTLLDKVNLKMQIFVNKPTAIFKHQIAAFRTGKIATALVWTCYAKVSGKNCYKTVGIVVFYTDWLNVFRPSHYSMARSCLKSYS